ASAVDVAGPIVATILVLRRSAAIDPNLARPRTGERLPARIRRATAELALDPQQLVVLGDAVRARRRPRLDLAGAERDREVGDRRVLRLPRAMRHHGRIAVRLREPHRLDRLGERPD